jgi:hypothetical protein
MTPTSSSKSGPRFPEFGEEPFLFGEVGGMRTRWFDNEMSSEHFVGRRSPQGDWRSLESPIRGMAGSPQGETDTFRPPPPIPMPNCVCRWAFFLKSCAPARVGPDSRGLRTGARTPENARFQSLPAVPRFGLALLTWPDVRKDHQSRPYRSESYARTNQTVEFFLSAGEGTRPDSDSGECARMIKKRTMNHGDDSEGSGREHHQ